MLKLIFINQTKATAIATGGALINKWEDSAKDYFKSLVFTNDGHLLTHGIDFSITSSVSATNLVGGTAGSLPYQSAADTTAFIAAPTSSASNVAGGNYILSYDSTNSAPIWKKAITYKLSLNGSTTGTNVDSATSLGTIYAPTTVGSNHLILQSSGSGAPSWASLVTSLSSSEDYTIPTSYAVKQAITNATSGLTGAMHFKGTTTTEMTDGRTTAAVTIEGNSYTPTSGDVVLYDNKEFVWTGSLWEILGDEGSYLLKSAKPLSSQTLSIGTGTIGSGITVDLAGITVTNSPATGNNIVNGVTTDSYGRVTAVSYATAALTDTTHNFFVGGSGAKANATSATSNPYLTTKLTSAAASADGTNIVQFKGTDYLTVSANNGIITFTNNGIKTASVSASVASNASGVYTIGSITINGSSTTLYGHDINTWREIKVYKISSGAQDGTIDLLLATGTGTNPLKFSNTFSVNSSDEIDLVWMEIDSSGNATYSV